MKNKRLGEMLIDEKVITQEQLEEALRQQKETGKHLGDVLIDNKIITPHDLVRTLQMQLGIDFVDPVNEKIDPDLIKFIPKNQAFKFRMVPVKLEGDRLFVAMDDPLNFRAIEAARTYSKKRITPMIAYSNAISKALGVLYENEGASQAIKQMQQERDMTIEERDSLRMAAVDDESAPTVKLVNSILERSISAKASDIHIEPMSDAMRVRIRVDGRLEEILSIPKELQNTVISYFKVMCDMNITERRIPQDGRTAMKRPDGTTMDMRVSTLPSIYGEKIVIRLLWRDKNILNRKGIGLTDADGATFERILKNSSGLILIVGPTGSGKTSTLYTMIGELNKDSVNMISLEDPVEFHIEGVTQVAINEKVGLTFASALRSCLRQDPDIICVGEIRDGETARIAMQAAITGHLVLSTVHTEDAASAIDRLRDLGAEPYLIGGSLRGVISQRLVRRICPSCKEEIRPDLEVLDLIEFKDPEFYHFYHGSGCANCYNSGYRGRTGVFEIMAVNSELRASISEGMSGTELRQALKKTGFTPMLENGRTLVKEGVTTAEEVLRCVATI
jgi:type IV pilus assembly protein PilB